MCGCVCTYYISGVRESSGEIYLQHGFTSASSASGGISSSAPPPAVPSICCGFLFVRLLFPQLFFTFASKTASDRSKLSNCYVCACVCPSVWNVTIIKNFWKLTAFDTYTRWSVYPPGQPRGFHPAKPLPRARTPFRSAFLFFHFGSLISFRLPFIGLSLLFSSLLVTLCVCVCVRLFLHTFH